MFITEAYAQTAPAASGGLLDNVQGMVPLLFIMVMFYFLLIRPQQKRAKDHRAAISALRRGDKVVTGGGIVGTVVKVQDSEVTVEIADNVKVKVIAETITTIMSKSEPVSGKSANDAEPAKPAEEGKSGSLLGKLLSGKKD